MSHSSEVSDKDFEQSRVLWHLMQQEGQSDEFLQNLCPNLGKADQGLIEEGISECCLVNIFCGMSTDDCVEMFARVDEGLGKAIAQGIKNFQQGKPVV